MIHHLGGWLRLEGRGRRAQGHLARWHGRHWAHLTYAVRIEPTSL